MSLLLPWFIFTARGDPSLLFGTPSLSPFCAGLSFAGALLTCAPNSREGWAPLGPRRGTPRRGAHGSGRRATALVPEVGQAWGVPWALVLFAVVSDASSPSSSLMKDADVFREEVQLELDSTLGTQGGTCSQNPANLKEVFVHRSCPAVTAPPPPPDECQFIFQWRHPWLGGGGLWSEQEGTQRKRRAWHWPQERPRSTRPARVWEVPLSPPAQPWSGMCLVNICATDYEYSSLVIPSRNVTLFFSFLGEGADGVSCDSRDSVCSLKRWGTYF